MRRLPVNPVSVVSGSMTGKAIRSSCCRKLIPGCCGGMAWFCPDPETAGFVQYSSWGTLMEQRWRQYCFGLEPGQGGRL